MLRLLLILIFALSAPAMPAGACEGAAPLAMLGHHMPQHHGGGEHKAPPAQHLCVGCVPIGDVDAARLTPPVPFTAPDPVARIARLKLRPLEAPTPPPPRIA
jgi:hypothetical protein